MGRSLRPISPKLAVIPGLTGDHRGSMQPKREPCETPLQLG